MILPAIVLMAAAAASHPFGLDDWTAMRSAQAISVNKSGSLILYQVTHGVQKGPSAQEWWTVRPDGTNAAKLSLPKGFKPSGFIPDGGLYGTYARGSANPQVAVLQPGAPAPRVITKLANGAGAVALSPDGVRIATLASNEPPDPLASVRTVVENGVSTPYVVNVDGSDGRWWCPAHANVSEMAWSPDGASLALLSQTPKIGHHEVMSFVDICTDKASRHVTTIANAAAAIAWIGGGTLAVVSTRTPVLTPDHVYTMPASGGAAIDRTPDLAGSATALTSDPAGNVWVVVQRGVQPQIERFARGSLWSAYRFPGGSISALPVFSPLRGSTHRLAFTVNDPTHSANVAAARGESLARITHEGDDVLARVALGKVAVVHWQGPQTPLSAIVTFPADYEPGKKYPFVQLPHGGPEANDVLSFDAFSRLVAGRGYVVMQPEYRGSTGINSAFLAAIYQHFGDRAYADVDSGTDYAVARGWADPRRLAMFGWSAGGFMTAWTVTQTGRYRAAVEGAGITDWLPFIPASDIAQIDYDARSHIADPQAFLKFSPVMFADRVTTPLLILQGEADLRVPPFQSREYFIFLRELGKTARMVTYPGSPHFPRLWEQRRNVFTEVFDWLGRYDPP